jgi:hypothetical protein
MIFGLADGAIGYINRQSRSDAAPRITDALRELIAGEM